MYFDNFHLPTIIVSRWNLRVRKIGPPRGYLTDQGRVADDPDGERKSILDWHRLFDVPACKI